MLSGAYALADGVEVYTPEAGTVLLQALPFALTLLLAAMPSAGVAGGIAVVPGHWNMLAQFGRIELVCPE